MPQRLLFIFALAALATASLSAQTATGPRSGKWAHETHTALKPDPRVMWGRLENGLRYALLPHAGVPGRVSMRLIMLTGSLDERDDERGIAHFTEHMCFRGTRRFPYAEMVGFFQRLGMEYGSDVNAVTSLENTTYQLDFRDNDPALLHQGLRLYRDFIDGVLFDETYIARERFVILSEKRLRGGINADEQSATLPLLLRGLNHPNRDPIGLPEQIRNFHQPDFLEFHRRNYRPDLAVLVVTGDIEPRALTALIADELDAIPARTDPIPPRLEGRLEPVRGLRADTLKITSVGGVRVFIGSAIPTMGKPDTRENRLETIRRSFAFDLFSERLDPLLENGSNGSAGYDTVFGCELAFAVTTTAPATWSDALTSLDELIRATAERGFEPREVERARSHRLAFLQHAAAQTALVDPAILASELVDSVLNHRVYLGSSQDIALLKDALTPLKPADLQRAFRASWALDKLAFHLAGEIPFEGGPAKILKAVQTARRAPLRTFRLESRKDTVFDLPPIGEPGAVVETREIPELRARLSRFANNVRFNFVSSKQQPGLVQAIVRVGSGLLDMPGSQPALKDYGLQTLIASGTTHFTPEKIGEIIDDHLLAFGFDTADNDAFAFRGLTAPDKLEVFLGLVTEFVHQPRFQTFAHREEKVKAVIERLSGAFGIRSGLRELNDYLFKGDARFTAASFNNTLGISAVDVRAWLQPQLARGYLEVTIVGDIDEAAATALIARTLGALPARDATKKIQGPVRPLRVSAPSGFARIEFTGEQHQAIVIGTWPVNEPIATRDAAAIHLLSRLLDLRVVEKVRDELGLAYSPRSQFVEYDGFTDFALLQTTIDGSPEETTRIARLLETIAADVAAQGVGDAEFTGARGILVGRLRAAFPANGYTLDTLKRAQEHPESIDEALALRAGLVETITRADIDRWAAKILPARNSRTVAIVPKPFVGVFQSGAK